MFSLFFSLNKSAYQRSKYETSAFMIIDALRIDFVHGNVMKNLRQMIENKSACMFNLKVESPTVTMPRIKAITSGL